MKVAIYWLVGMFSFIMSYSLFGYAIVYNGGFWDNLLISAAVVSWGVIGFIGFYWYFRGAVN